MQSSLNAGVFVPDHAANVARLYYGVLGRRLTPRDFPEGAGLVDAGSFSFNRAQAFLNSPEYQNAHTGQSDAQFIDDLDVRKPRMPSRPDDQRNDRWQFFYSTRPAAKLYCPKYQAPSFSHTRLESQSVAFPFGH